MISKELAQEYLKRVELRICYLLQRKRDMPKQNWEEDNILRFQLIDEQFTQKALQKYISSFGMNYTP